MRTIVGGGRSRAPTGIRAIGFAIGWAILAGVIGLLVWFMIRSHPERWLARRLAVAGVVTIVAAGAFQLAAAGTRRAVRRPRRHADRLRRGDPLDRDGAGAR